MGVCGLGRPRVSLGVLAYLLVQLQLKSPESKSKSTEAIAKVDLDLDLGDLSGVSGWASHATSAQVPLVKAKSAEAQPMGT